jgi:hypothetical protein
LLERYTAVIQSVTSGGGGTGAIVPGSNIGAISTVSGSVVSQKKILAANVNATSVINGVLSVIGRKPIIPITLISATSIVSASLPSASKIIHPTTVISATSTITGRIVLVLHLFDYFPEQRFTYNAVLSVSDQEEITRFTIAPEERFEIVRSFSRTTN